MPMSITVKLTVLKDRGALVQTPHFETPPLESDPVGYYATTGVGPGACLSLSLRSLLFVPASLPFPSFLVLSPLPILHA